MPTVHNKAKYTHRHTQKSTTLMRKAVKKPKAAAKKQLKSQSELKKESVKYIKGTNKPLGAKPHSSHVKRSSAIKHFHINWDEVKSYQPEEYIPSQVIPPTRSNKKHSAQTNHNTHVSKLDKMLDQGINNATSHLQPPVIAANQSKHWPLIIAIIVVIILILFELHKA